MSRSKFLSRFPCVLMVATLAALPCLAVAGPKEDALASMQALAEQIREAKASGQDPAAAIAQLDAISASLGGDRPASGVSGNGPVVRGAVMTPPNCTVTTTNGSSTDTPIAIVDNATAVSNLSIAGAPTFTHYVEATLTINHTFAADLDITLTSPSGTVITLTTDNGAGNDDVFAPVTFTDLAGVPVTDATYTNLVSIGAVIPESAMAAVRGEDPNGTWVLSVGDDATGDTGTLQSWSLTIISGDVAPTDTVSSFSSTNVPVAIVDNTVANSTLSVSGADAFTCAVQLNTNITHTFAADLEVFLMSPAATTTTITTDNGAGNDDVFNGTQWYDKAGSPATDFAYTNLVTATPLVPEGAMGAFTGGDPNGTWTLMVGDDAAGDTGSLSAWSLDVTTCSCAVTGPPPVAVTVPSGSLWSSLLLIGLALGVGMIVLRRRLRRS
ncbi:MAG: proprotein convertase P-domain-containing protein [Dokdonella sp.]|nr:proprotein convertase P-domain-containing protein [Dokdonella sp.]MCB1572843.1 proprotein convertase P-domain-containing protein [Xanthomonadales bacterium]